MRCIIILILKFEDKYMVSSLSQLVDNNFLSSFAKFIGTYVSTAALDFSLKNRNGYRKDIYWQLFHCMQDAHEKTCEELHWEYDSEVYSELSKEILKNNTYLNNIKTLSNIFSTAIGHETKFEDIDCWLKNFQISLVSDEHSNLRELIKIQSLYQDCNIHPINKIYVQKFQQTIFSNDLCSLSLHDIYIPNEYKLSKDEQIHRDLLELIDAFIHDRIEIILKQKDIVCTCDINSLFIFGHQCTGKSTLISRLIYDNYLNDGYLSKNIYVCSFSDRSFRSIDLTPHNICKYLDINLNSLSDAILIIDGLDESEWSSSIALDKLEHLINDLKEFNCKLIVTSRPNFLYTVDFKNSIDIQLAPFSINQAIEWLELYKEFDPTCDILSIIEQINNLSNDIKNIILIPYVFRTCIEHRIQFESITELARLYDILFFDDNADFLETPYNSKLRNTTKERNLYRDKIIEVAIYSLHDSNGAIPSTFIDDFILDNSIPTNKITSEFLLYRKDADHYSFMHNSIPHYFIARYLYNEFLSNCLENQYDILIDKIKHINLILPSSILEFVEYFVRSNSDNDIVTPIKFLKLFLSNEFHHKLKFHANLTEIQQHHYLYFIDIVRLVFAFITPNIKPFDSFDFFALLTEDEKEQFIKYSNLGNTSLECLKICSFLNHKLDGVNFNGINLRGKLIYKSSIKNTNMNSATLSGAYFIESDFSLSKFDNSNCKNVDFSSSILFGCSFKNARLNGANFENANLDYADLRGSLLNKCKFDGASVKKAKIHVEQLRTIFDFDIEYIRKNKIEIYCGDCLLPDELLEDEYKKQRPVSYALNYSSKSVM